MTSDVPPPAPTPTSTTAHAKPASMRLEWVLMMLGFVVLALIFTAYYTHYEQQHSHDTLAQARETMITGYVLLFAIFAAVSGLALRRLQRRQRMLDRLSDELVRERHDHEVRTSAILEHIVDGIICINGKGIITSFNQAAVRMFGFSATEVIGSNVNMLMPAHYHDRHDGYLENYHASGIARVIGIGREVQGQRKDGSVFPMMLAVSHLVSQGEPLFIGLVRDITQAKQAEAEIQQLAFYDALTELPNRRLLIDRLGQAMAGSARGGQYGALLFIDLDNFKTINDTKGHTVGDKLLRQVARRLRQCVRERDTVARLGGDEFVVLLEGLDLDNQTAARQAHRVGSKILTALGQPYALGGHEHHATSSVGIALFNHRSTSVEELLKRADMAMYEAKAAGRNTLRFFDPAMQQAITARAALHADLRDALQGRQFVLYYQPQVQADGNPLGMEALIRWQHPVRGIVAPGDFIELTEQTGLIIPIGHWVQEAACRQLALWADDPARARLSLSINVSARQLRQADYVDELLATLARTGANPQRLKLELTESMLVRDIADIVRKMERLQAEGISFSLDDFGTGYSSLSYLKRLPLKQLKIDRSFVRDILTDPNDASIVQTIIALGNSLGLLVIAEGVETPEQCELLASYGCQAFQGYLFGRPGPAAEVLPLAAPEPLQR